MAAGCRKLELYPWQFDALRRFNRTILQDGTVRRFFAAFCGTGAGKSRFGSVWSLVTHQRIAAELLAAGETRQPLGLIVAPTYRHLERFAVGELLSVVRGTAHAARYSRHDGVLEFAPATGGGRAYCGSADRPESLEGAHIDWAWVDEAGLTSDLTWAVILARTQIRLAPVLLTSYWYSLQWCYTEWWQRWQAGDPAYDIVNYPSTANPKVSKAEFERLRRVMDERLFQMRHEGRPARMVGQVYAGAWNPADPVLHCDAPAVGPDWLCWLGVDQGYAPDPFHAVVMAECPDTGVIYAIGEYRANEKLTTENAVALTRLIDRLGVRAQTKRAYVDPANKQGLADLRAALRRVQQADPTLLPLDIAVNPAHNAVEAGIEAVFEAFKSGRLRIVRGRCPALVRELELYHRDPQGDLVKANDHGPDALRYGLYSWRRRATLAELGLG